MFADFHQVSALLGNWAHVLNFVNKAESSLELMGEVRKRFAVNSSFLLA
jgi:hypothetical protein